MTKNFSVLLASLLAVNFAWAQLAIPNPTIRPSAAAMSSAAAEGMPPVPQLKSPAARLDLPPPAEAGSAPSQAAVAGATAGLYVAAIVNNRAILRGQASTSGAPATGLPSMAPAPGAAAPSTAPRLVTFTVRDGETFLLADRIEVTARVSGKTVALYLTGGPKQLAFRGELDSIVPAAAVKPQSSDLMQRNTDFLQQRSVSDMSFSAGVAIGTSTPSPAPK